MKIKDYHLECTCGACPEQYDVFKDGKQVGYLRLRHGEFRADSPDCGDTTVFYADDMTGDGWFTDDERDTYLAAAIDAIHKHLNQ